ncbi:MFS transporter [Elizabethkingia miricola]|uniref:MFS transporter n=1 Tax=Elizabethkingia miricola TaxID=172045 RepID=UPI000B35266C|nr:MFS transporter [Elizabethkingia miricola]NHQ68505.1 multidrug effflux MFS transporter [Elizabethkingia miricola]NHQ72555.1 multidrug effflux MFS transporter [Elizabethkingia miricola]NHQ78349.1 multidrug effflux MFS transporter [Elizabethkingia miricola]PSL89262.1 MFS transporter [Elizabethkingia miricola]QHQ85425.1 multidrug effflux MFS transporter [Elizabethkingia miricola]
MLNKQLATKHQFIATILAFAVIPMSGLATDIYLPSMPSMAEDLHLPEARIQLTLTFYLISYGISQFFSGALVDAFGRYKISIMALVLFVVSFWITGHTQNIYVIYLMRIVQGILSGLVVVSKRAFFVDVYDGEERKHYLSIMTIVWSLGPIIAPFIGGYLQKSFGWQSNFTVLAGYSLIILILELVFSGETIKNKNPFHIGFLWNEFKTMLGTLDFFFGMLMCGVSYALIMFYNLCGPFIIEHKLGYSSVTTGYLSLLMGLAWMSGGFLGKALISRPFLPKLRYSNFLQLLFIILMFASSFYVENLLTLVLFAFVIHVTAGFMFNNYFAYCLGRFPKSAGISGGITGGVVYIITSVVSYGIAAVIKPVQQTGIAEGYFAIGVLGFIILTFIKRKKAHI